MQHAVIADNVPPVFVLFEMFCLKRQTNDANDVQRYKKNDTVANFLDFFCDFTSLHDKMQTTHHHLIHSTAPPAALIAHYNTHYILHTQLPQRTPRKRQKHATRQRGLFTHNRVALQQGKVALWQRKSAAVEMPHATTACSNTIFLQPRRHCATRGRNAVSGCRNFASRKTTNNIF